MIILAKAPTGYGQTLVDPILRFQFTVWQRGRPVIDTCLFLEFSPEFLPVGVAGLKDLEGILQAIKALDGTYDVFFVSRAVYLPDPERAAVPDFAAGYFPARLTSGTGRPVKPGLTRCFARDAGYARLYVRKGRSCPNRKGEKMPLAKGRFLKAIEETFSGTRLEINKRAFELGYQAVAES